jgi:hypothetical protein
MHLRLHRLYLALRGRAGGGGDVLPPTYQASEVGDVTSLTLRATFSEPVNSDTSDYITGTTIKVNSVAYVILSGTRQADQAIVHYVFTHGLDPLPDPNDTITFEYSDVLGDLEDLANNQLGDVAAQTADNNIGEHFWGDELMDSAHMLVTSGL